MNKKITAFAAVLLMAAAAQALEFSYEASTTWVGNSYESISGTPNYYWLFYADGEQAEFNNDNIPNGVSTTNGTIGQVFDVTNEMTVATIKMWSQRWYNTNDMTIRIYKNVNTDIYTVGGVKPIVDMTPENLVAEFTLDPGDSAPRSSSGSGNGDILTINLATNEFFDLVPLGSNDDDTNYYFTVDFENVDYGTNTPWRLFLWNAAGGDPNGRMITPEGEFNDDRDLGLAFVSTTPPEVIYPDIPTNWILAEADTYFRPLEKGDGDHNESSETLGLRNYDDGSGVSTARDYWAMVRFNLSDLAGKTITSARFEVDQASGDSTDNGNRVQFKGLDNVVSNTPQDWAESITVGELGLEFVATNNTVGIDPFVTDRVTDLDGLTVTNIVEEPPTTTNTTHAISGPALVDFLNARLADPDTNGVIRATFILGSRMDGGRWTIQYNSREVNETTRQDQQPRLILEWSDGPAVGPQFDPVINGISASGDMVMIMWDSDSNGTYRVESKSALTDSTWMPTSATNLTGGAGRSTQVPMNGDTEFYRVYGE